MARPWLAAVGTRVGGVGRWREHGHFPWIAYDQAMEQPDHHPGLAEDWTVLESFLPPNWREMAVSTGALKGLRKDKSADNLLRVLLMHLGCGHSLQETVVRARQAQLAELTAAALWNRLQKSAVWLRGLCAALFRERGLEQAGAGGIQVRALDATTVKELGPYGSQWRIHHSVRLPSLLCDFFGLTAAAGAGTGQSFKRFPINAGDYLLAGQRYSTVAGLRHVEGIDAFATVPVKTESIKLGTLEGGPFDLLAALDGLRARVVGCWPAAVLDRGGTAVVGRVCAVRKSTEAIRLARQRFPRASQRSDPLQSRTLELSRYVILFTTFPRKEFPAEDVLEWYRTYWQVELVFKRFKSLAQLGHVPKQADESAKAWLYGKLLVALLIEKLVDHARYISPWGCDMKEASA